MLNQTRLTALPLNKIFYFNNEDLFIDQYSKKVGTSRGNYWPNQVNVSALIVYLKRGPILEQEINNID